MTLFESQSAFIIIISQFMQFSQQLQHHVPVVNCRLVNLDWTLFHSVNIQMHINYPTMSINIIVLQYIFQQMIAAYATYLVILIQFDSANKGVELYYQQLMNTTQ